MFERKHVFCLFKQTPFVAFRIYMCVSRMSVCFSRFYNSPRTLDVWLVQPLEHTTSAHTITNQDHRVLTNETPPTTTTTTATNYSLHYLGAPTRITWHLTTRPKVLQSVFPVPLYSNEFFHFSHSPFSFLANELSQNYIKYCTLISCVLRPPLYSPLSPSPLNIHQVKCCMCALCRLS